VEFIRRDDVRAFANSGVTSQQLLFPENSRSARVTITRVLLQPGVVNPRHRHATSEQVWVALSGSARLLLADELTAPFVAGDIVRFEDGEVHGLENTGPSAFEYLSVTAPPLNFRAAYAAEWSRSS
jgi:quercetin dioxygenase-like cupin family protein